MKTADAVAAIATRLAAAGIEEPRREARMLLQAAMGVDAAGLLLLDAVAGFEGLVARREAREPLAYILGRREFWGMDFEVSPATLIPRPDTETLVESAVAALPERGNVRAVLDLGTGTGCLLLACLSEFSGAFGVGVDVSAAAAGLAARNARRLGFGGRAAFLVGDWAAGLARKFDLVVSNPPYIPAGDVAGLMPEVAEFEPAGALAGGADGLECYRSIIGQLPEILSDSGVAILELGIGQDRDVAVLAENAGYATEIRRDLANIARALLIRP